MLTLLADGPRYGYELRASFEQRTGGSWPLNIGQVYTTLRRLERDELVEAGDADDSGHVFYRITAAGSAEVSHWFATPVDRVRPQRDELAMKLAMAAGAPGTDITAIVQTQRSHTMQALQGFTRLKQAADPADIGWLMLLESYIFQAEAEIRWLEWCEGYLIRVRTFRDAPELARTIMGRTGQTMMYPMQR